MSHTDNISHVTPVHMSVNTMCPCHVYINSISGIITQDNIIINIPPEPAFNIYQYISNIVYLLGQ